MAVRATEKFSKKANSPEQGLDDLDGAPNSTVFDADNQACPISSSGGNQPSSLNLTNWDEFKSEVDDRCKYFGIENIESVKENFFDTVKKSFRSFFDSLASCGNAKNSKSSPDVVTGVGNALQMLSPAATTGMSVAKMLASSFETLCARIADAFNSSPDEVARTIFSGFCIVSAGIRSALPMLAEMARQAKNPEEIFIVSIASAVMASVYLATSAISTLLAGHNAILNSPTTAEMAKKVRDERDSVDPNVKNLSEVAQASLKKIGNMLKAWRKNVSSNFLALAKEVMLFAGAAISCFSALAKFAPVLAVPFVSIISGSVSLVINVLETAQGIVDHSRINGELKQLRQRIENGENPTELNSQIKNLERQLHLSKVRIMKGGLNILLSIGSIVLGVLPLVMSFSMPILPAILATLSLASVVVLGVAGLVVRRMNNAGNSVSNDVANEDDSDSGTQLRTDSENDEDNDSDNQRVVETKISKIKGHSDSTHQGVLETQPA